MEKKDFICRFYNDKTGKINWEEVEKTPEFSKLKETPQNPLWHREGNAYIHTCKVVEAMEQIVEKNNYDHITRKIMLLAALFHDVGKGVTTYFDAVDKKSWTSPNHAMESMKIARRLLWGINPVYREQICALVANHMQPLYVKTKGNPIHKIIELASDRCGSLNLLLHLKEADCRGSIVDPAMDDNWEKDLEWVKKKAVALGCLYDTTKLFNNGKHRRKYLENKDYVYPSDVEESEYREQDFDVVFMIGLPGSGKTTCRGDYRFEDNVVCRDDIRTSIGLKGEKPQGNAQQEKEVTKIQNEMIKDFADNKQDFIIDATNLKKKYRDDIKNMLKPYNCMIHYHYVEAPSFEETLKRRDGMINPDIIIKMRDSFDFPRPWEADEVLFDLTQFEK